jgi:hypothetical protein
VAATSRGASVHPTISDAQHLRASRFSHASRARSLWNIALLP